MLGLGLGLGWVWVRCHEWVGGLGWPGRGRESRGVKASRNRLPAPPTRTHTSRRPACSKQQQRDRSCFDTESTGQQKAEHPRDVHPARHSIIPNQDFLTIVISSVKSSTAGGVLGQDMAGVGVTRESLFSLIPFFERCSLSYRQDRCYRVPWCKNEKQQAFNIYCVMRSSAREYFNVTCKLISRFLRNSNQRSPGSVREVKRSEVK